MLASYAAVHRSEYANLLQASETVRRHIEHGTGGPFDGAPTADPGVRVLCRVLEHYKRRMRRIDRELYAPNPFQGKGRIA